MKFDLHILNDTDWSDFHFAFNPVFGHQYARINRADYQVYRYSGKVTGFIPVLLKKSKFFRTIQLLCYPADDDGNKLNHQDEKYVLEHFVQFLKEKKIAHRIVQGTNWALFSSVPTDAKYCNFGSYQLNLKEKTQEQICTEIHPKHRNVIRNAEKSGAKILEGADQLAIFYSLYSKTMLRNNMYCEPFEFFESVLKDCSGIYCGVVYYNDEPQGAIYAPYSKFGGYYVYGASAEKITLTGAINFLHFQFIHFLMENHVAQYDFVGARLSAIEGTKYEGIQKFKARFGGELLKGFLWKIDLNTNICFIYDTLLKAKLMLKNKQVPKDIIDQERSKL